MEKQQFVSAKLQGGLGNILFQVAAAYSVAKKNNVTAKFVIVPYAIKWAHGSEPLKYIDSLLSQIERCDTLPVSIVYKEPHFHYSAIPFSPNMLLDGFFQSEKYFHDCKNDILSLFQIDELRKEKIISFLKQAFGDTVVVGVHVRRGDYVKYSTFLPPASILYYERAMKLLSDWCFQKCKFLFVSDDMKWVKENFKGANIEYSPFTKDIDDFTLLSHCSHNIIANSSFSWWAAYLNKSINKIVVAPQKWFGPEGPQDWFDIYPKGWKIIPKIIEDLPYHTC